MKQELDPKVAFGAIALIIVLVVAVYVLVFRTPSGELTPQQAGAGTPAKPGEMPPGMENPYASSPSPTGGPQPGQPPISAQPGMSNPSQGGTGK